MYVRAGHGRYLAEHIAGARLLELDSADHWPLPEPELLGAIEEFVTGRATRDSRIRIACWPRCSSWTSSARQSRPASSATKAGGGPSTVFERRFATVSTLYAGELTSTRRRRDPRDVRRPGARHPLCLAHQGCARPQRARGSQRAAHGRGDEEGRRCVRASPSTSARVCPRLAEPGEVLVTRTVRDLVAGSGISFEERGEHELKGVPDRWALYAAV